ncbi:hypothetical protein [Deinococcus sp. AJ005]|uniref:hypothetical protein n=1 Tax=Deinococcus sp. AJ005 TaxID=2652443 RepID=UPI00125CBD11|nr:hypothetical protein [Deinococcus sp. AJ005]QFP77469.1 hypothetical protein DAAJ005_14110 [Deinococcus sp. AJ005]
MKGMLCTTINWEANHLCHPLGHALHRRGQRAVTCLVSRSTSPLDARYVDPFNPPGLGELRVPESELNTAIRMARAAWLDHLICTRLEEHFGPSYPQQVTIDATGRHHTDLIGELVELVEWNRRLQRLVLWVQFTGEFEK